MLFPNGMEHATEFIDHLFGASVQMACSAVITQSAPQTQDFIQTGCSQCLNIWKCLQKTRVVAHDRRHLGLLQHDFGQPHPVRVAGVLPRQIMAAMLAPRQWRSNSNSSRCAPTAAMTPPASSSPPSRSAARWHFLGSLALGRFFDTVGRKPMMEPTAPPSCPIEEWAGPCTSPSPASAPLSQRSTGPTTPPRPALKQEPATTGPVGDAGFANPIVVPASRLVQGANVLAVEVHQSSPTSSDLAFDLAMTGAAPITDIEKSLAADAPVLVIDADSGRVLATLAKRHDDGFFERVLTAALHSTYRLHVRWAEGTEVVMESTANGLGN